MFHGNTTVSIMRGTETDEYGDVKDTATIIKTGVRASIIEQSRRVFVPADNVDRVVRYVRGRLPSNEDVREGDRLFDERSESTYIVEAVVQPGSPYAHNDVRVDLKYVT
jgi:hypothetical protein